MGYWIAGLDPEGIDTVFQKNYPFLFTKMDAIEFAQQTKPDYAFIHASPPCQIYSSVDHLTSPHEKGTRVDLIDETRECLLHINEMFGTPYIIENVAGSPLIDPIMLCGTNFGLKTYRHRYFEIGPPEHPLRNIIHQHVQNTLPHIPHVRPQAKLGRSPMPYEFMQVVSGLSDVNAARTALGIDWMNRDELGQAIPPAYTAYLGCFIRNYLDEINKHKPLFQSTTHKTPST